MCEAQGVAEARRGIIAEQRRRLWRLRAAVAALLLALPLAAWAGYGEGRSSAPPAGRRCLP